MSREIKFRGKTKDGRWVQGVPIKNGFGKLTFMCFATSDILSCPMEQIYKFCIEVIPETVRQYIGLKDKNGIEVYVGDIVKCSHGCPHEVIWLQEHGGNFIGGMPAFYLSQMRAGYAWTNREEVIGNIYENPELLEDTHAE